MQSMEAKNLDNLRWLSRLNMLGNVVRLKVSIDPTQLLNEIEPFSDEWKRYNPRKPIDRWGLSVTSYDGGLSGVPDLDSISEYNLKNNTNYKTDKCNVFTPVYQNSKILQNLVAPWKHNIGRSHFLKLNSGGYFPEHRDSYDIDESDQDYQDVVRFIVFIKNCNSSTFKFIIDDQLRTFQTGKLYYFNSMLSHSLFSFKDDCIMLVFVVKFDYSIYKYIVSNLDQV